MSFGLDFSLFLSVFLCFFSFFSVHSLSSLQQLCSQTKDPRAVQPFLNKCFEGIAKIAFNGEETGREEDVIITKIKSAQGTFVSVHFSSFIDQCCCPRYDTHRLKYLFFQNCFRWPWTPPSTPTKAKTKETWKIGCWNCNRACVSLWNENARPALRRTHKWNGGIGVLRVTPVNACWTFHNCTGPRNVKI